MMSGEHAPTVYLRCQRCETIALTDELYCFSCGLPLKYICRICGQGHHHRIANYCPYCGSGNSEIKRDPRTDTL